MEKTRRWRILGGCQLLAQTDALCPASEVMGHHLYCELGGVGDRVGAAAALAMPCFRRRWSGGPAEPAVPCCCGVAELCAFAAYWLF